MESSRGNEKQRMKTASRMRKRQESSRGNEKQRIRENEIATALEMRKGRKSRPTLRGKLIVVAEGLADANVPMDEIKEGFIDVLRMVHDDLQELAANDNDSYEDALNEANQFLVLINKYLQAAEEEYEYNIEQEGELPPPISEAMMRANPRRRRNPSNMQINFNNYREKLTEDDIDQIVGIICKGCRPTMWGRIRKTLEYFPISIPHLGIFERLIKENGKWRYIAGQSYPDEIKTVRESILK
jgi:hypothetical protein